MNFFKVVVYHILHITWSVTLSHVQQNRQNSLTNIEQRFSSSFRRGCSRGEEEYLRRIIMESLLIPKIRKQSLTLDVVYGNPTDDDFEAIDAKRAWVRGETLMRISPPRNNANAAENDDQSKIIQTTETETTTERRRNRVKTLLFHAEKDLVEIDSIKIDGQKGRWRRIFVDEEEDTNFTTTTTNTTPKAATNAFFDDSIVERIKLMKQVEDESLMTMNTGGGGGSIGSTCTA